MANFIKLAGFTVLMVAGIGCGTNTGNEQEDVQGSVATPPELMPAPDTFIPAVQTAVADSVPARQDTNIVAP